MKVRFKAKGDLLVRYPLGRAAVHRKGALCRYVGRTLKLSEDKTQMSFPAADAVVEAEHDSVLGKRLIKQCRKEYALWPADKDTAQICGRPFVETTFKDGEHVPATKRAAKPEK